MMCVPAIPYRVDIGRSEIFVYDETGRFSWPSTCQKVWCVNASGGITEVSERVRLKLVDHPTFTVGPKKFNRTTWKWE